LVLSLELQRRSMLQRQIARGVGVSTATVSRVLAAAGLSKLSDQQRREPDAAIEHGAPFCFPVSKLVICALPIGASLHRRPIARVGDRLRCY
jgi:hypothetical protein